MAVVHQNRQALFNVDLLVVALPRALIIVYIITSAYNVRTSPEIQR